MFAKTEWKEWRDFQLNSCSGKWSLFWMWIVSYTANSLLIDASIDWLPEPGRHLLFEWKIHCFFSELCTPKHGTHGLFFTENALKTLYQSQLHYESHLLLAEQGECMILVNWIGICFNPIAVLNAISFVLELIVMVLHFQVQFGTFVAISNLLTCN